MFGSLALRVLNADNFKNIGFYLWGDTDIKLERTAIAARSPTVATKEMQDATINACGDKNGSTNEK
jgi:hypothetical protein